MRNLEYSCKKRDLHPNLSEVFTKKLISDETEVYRDKKSSLYSLKFIFFIIMSVLGFRHYNTMGILGYDTFLFEADFAKKLIKKKKEGALLDIGAGNGSITEKFEPFTNTISCLEPSLSFQKILKKKGYRICDAKDTKKYTLITIFNVLDVCEDPQKIINHAMDHLAAHGTIMISMPFPIRARSWDKSDIHKTNHLSQPG